jgi:capsular polysaccharide transport system ATP-binding protein
MIRFENVVKTYRLNRSRKTVFRNLTGGLPKANIAILGANGAGKSTLLRLIAGTDLPDSGRIRREGRISWPLGFAGSFNGSLSGAENVRFVARIYGKDTERVLDFVEEFAELGQFFREPFSTYSAGMRARLAFGVSMAIAFDCYLVDEITAVGDARFSQKCHRMFKEKLRTSSILMVSHSIGTLRDYCDMGAVVRDGGLYVYDDIKDAIAEHERVMRN